LDTPLRHVRQYPVEASTVSSSFLVRALLPGRVRVGGRHETTV
jgi:hypothetical protein